MNERKDKGFIELKILAKLCAVLGLTFFLVANYLCTHEILVNLRVKVIAVGNDKESKVAFDLTFHLAGKHNHRIRLATTLRMPKYAELTRERLAILDRLDQIIYTKIFS
jgi:hypothetical protein